MVELNYPQTPGAHLAYGLERVCNNIEHMLVKLTFPQRRSFEPTWPGLQADLAWLGLARKLR